MNCSPRFALRSLLLIALFVLTFSLTIQYIVNGQDDKEPGFRFRLTETKKSATPTPAPAIAAPQPTARYG